MEKKSNYNLEKTRTTNFMSGFLFISGIVLATLSYGVREPIEIKQKSYSLENNNLLVDAIEKPKEVFKQPEVKPQAQQSTQKDDKVDLNNDVNTNQNTAVVNDKPFVDLGLPKGDTTVIVQNDPTPILTPSKVEEFPDVDAEFPGGYEEWKKYLLKELKYPEIAIENDDKGTVFLSFVVELDGSIGDIRVVKSVSFEIDREAKRVIKNSPKWKPGRISNQIVRTRMNIPIRFDIN
jgi:protein TonB